MLTCRSLLVISMFLGVHAGSARADRPRAEVQLVSHGASTAQTGNGQSDNGMGISADGSLLIYRTLASDLVAGVTDDNAAGDVVLYDRRSRRHELISRRHDDALRSASAASFPLALSNDGRFVLFYSEAPDIVAMTDANGGGSTGRDLFLHDRQSGLTRLLTRSATAPTLTSSNAGMVNSVVMSANGDYVAFMSAASDIVTGVTHPMPRTQIYVYTRATDSFRLLTTRGANPAVASNSLNPFVHRISDDGNWVLFNSDGSDLVSGVSAQLGWSNLYLFTADGTTRMLLTHVAGNPNSACAAGVGRADMNADATRIVFGSWCATHVAGVSDTNAVEDIFRFDRPGNTMSLLSFAHDTPTQTANGASEFPKLATTGDVLFRSTASNLVAPGVDGNGVLDVYIRTAASGIELITVSATAAVAANAVSFPGLDPISDDGRFVTWSSDASDLDADVLDDNATRDVFVRDRLLGKTELVSVRSTLPLRSAGGFSALGAAMTADGTAFVFGSFGSELSADHVDSNGVADAMVGYFGALFSDSFE